MIKEISFKKFKKLIDIDFSFNEDINIISGTKIRPQLQSIETEIQKRKDNHESTSGLRRRLNKKIFNQHIEFFRMITRNWLDKPENQKSLQYFYNGLRSLFYRVTPTNGIDRKIWDFDYNKIIKEDK